MTHTLAPAQAIAANLPTAAHITAALADVDLVSVQTYPDRISLHVHGGQVDTAADLLGLRETHDLGPDLRERRGTYRGVRVWVYGSAS